MSKYIVLLLLLVSCGARKVNKSDVQVVKTSEQTVIDSSKVVINTQTNTKVVDTSEESDICVVPLDTTKPFIYENKTFKNAVLKIKKHKNNITIQSDEKVSEKRQNNVITTHKDKAEIEVKQKEVERKESIYPFMSLLFFLILAYIIYRVYDKNKYI